MAGVGGSSLTGGLGSGRILQDSVVGVGGLELTLGSGLGVGGIDGGMGRTCVGNEGIAGVVKVIVRHIEAGVWHTHDVGLEEQFLGDLVGSEIVGDLVGSEEQGGELTEQVFIKLCVKGCINVNVSLIMHPR